MQSICTAFVTGLSEIDLKGFAHDGFRKEGLKCNLLPVIMCPLTEISSIQASTILECLIAEKKERKLVAVVDGVLLRNIHIMKISTLQEEDDGRPPSQFRLPGINFYFLMRSNLQLMHTIKHSENVYGREYIIVANVMIFQVSKFEDFHSQVEL
uniref:Uncharacterized protein n=1 Tax=Glossina austeni TaxID=7395 RepID=A0A1A9V568_GLOAU